MVGDGVRVLAGLPHVRPEQRVPLRRRPDALERLVEHQRVGRYLLHYRHRFQSGWNEDMVVKILFCLLLRRTLIKGKLLRYFSVKRLQSRLPSNDDG